MLALILALQNFQVYVVSATRPIVHTIHNPLVFIPRMKNQNQRLARWSVTLQEFDVDICHIKSEDNSVANALSRSY